jgi:hypothetical protein
MIERFVALTASEQWFTAEELVTRLDAGGYWSTHHPSLPVKERVAHTIRQLEAWVDRDGKPLFASLEIRDSSDAIQRVYKQNRLIPQREPRS